MIRTTRPDSREFEVTLMGPGTGESLVVHMGDNRWMIVDCFVDGESGEAAPLEYLRRINVDLDRVEAIVVTHLHMDHYKAIWRVHEACQKARLILSSALTEAGALKVYAQRPENELYGTLHAASARQLPGNEPGMIRVHCGSSVRNAAPCRATAIAPTHAACNDAEAHIAGLAARVIEARSSKDRAAARVREITNAGEVDPDAAGTVADLLQAADDSMQKAMAEAEGGLRDENRCSVGIHVQFSPDGPGALLAADMVSHDQYGWQALVSENCVQPCGKVSLLKVPHHGSERNDCGELWDRWVDAGAVALVAPFRSSGLPRDSDIARIQQRSGSIWQAAPSSRARDVVDGTDSTPKTGIVQARWSHATSTWTLATDGPAFRHRVSTPHP